MKDHLLRQEVETLAVVQHHGDQIVPVQKRFLHPKRKCPQGVTGALFRPVGGLPRVEPVLRPRIMDDFRTGLKK